MSVDSHATRSIEQKLALICYHFLQNQRKPTTTEYKAAVAWLTRIFPRTCEDLDLSDLLAFVLCQCDGPSQVPLPDMMPDGMFAWLADGLELASRWCPLVEGSSKEELRSWGLSNVWARFLQLNLRRANVIEEPPRADAPAEATLRKFLSIDEAPSAMLRRARHLIVMSCVPIGSYTQYVRSNPSVGVPSISANDIALFAQKDPSQANLNPKGDWESMTCGTREIWLMEALSSLYSAVSGTDYLGSHVLLYLSELGVSGVATRLTEKRCPATRRPRLPLIVHLGGRSWQINSPALKAAVVVQGAVHAYDTWLACVRKHYKGKTEEMNAVPSTAKLLAAAAR